MLFMTDTLFAQSGTLTVDVKEAGTLSTLVPESEKYSATEIKVTGQLNGTDVKFLRDMAGVDSENGDTEGKLTDIDLSGATIVAGGDEYLSYFSTDTWEDVVLTTEDDVFPASFFYGTYISRVVLPESVNKIGNDALKNCSQLTHIDIPAGVTEIGSNAFSGSGLTEIDLPSTVTKIGSYCFWGCTNMVRATLSEALESLPEGAFSQASVSEINIPDAITSIGTAAFQYCYSLKKVTGCKNVTSFGSYAFNRCTALEAFSLPEGLKSMGTQCFSNCTALTGDFLIPSTVESIGKEAFINCSSLSSIVVADDNVCFASEGGVLYSKDGKTLLCCPAGKTGEVEVSTFTEKIQESAFDNCALLQKVVLPAALSEVGNNAFNFASRLTTITCLAVEPPAIGWSGAFFMVPVETCELNVPAGSIEKYAEAEGWKDFKNIKSTTTGIELPVNSNENATYYGINGLRQDAPRKGINIKKTSNGKVKKILIR